MRDVMVAVHSYNNINVINIISSAPYFQPLTAQVINICGLPVKFIGVLINVWRARNETTI